MKDVESATSTRNATDIISTSLKTLLSTQSRICLRITPTPYSLFQRRFSCRDMTTQRTAETEGKKYHTGGRLCSERLRKDKSRLFVRKTGPTTRIYEDYDPASPTLLVLSANPRSGSTRNVCTIALYHTCASDGGFVVRSIYNPPKPNCPLRWDYFQTLIRSHGVVKPPLATNLWT